MQLDTLRQDKHIIYCFYSHEWLTKQASLVNWSYSEWAVLTKTHLSSHNCIKKIGPLLLLLAGYIISANKWK
jgi:hypothetical protein